MFLKKMICIGLTLLSLYTMPSAIKRDISSASLAGEDWRIVNTPTGASAAGVVISTHATPRAQAATPNSQIDDGRVTPSEQISPKKPVLSPLNTNQIKEQKQIAEPTVCETPQSRLTQNTQTSSQLSSPSKESNPAPQTSTINFLITPTNSTASSIPFANNPQQVPVEALPPITPTTSSPTVLTKTVVATALLAHSTVIATTTSKPAARPPILNLSEQERAAALSALSLQPSHICAQTLIAAQHPMQLPPTMMRPKTASSGDLSITIAPASPSKPQNDESEKSTNCCMPITCCGKQLFSGNIPSCPCPVKGCVIL